MASTLCPAIDSKDSKDSAVQADETKKNLSSIKLRLSKREKRDNKREEMLKRQCLERVILENALAGDQVDGGTPAGFLRERES